MKANNFIKAVKAATLASGLYLSSPFQLVNTCNKAAKKAKMEADKIKRIALEALAAIVNELGRNLELDDFCKCPDHLREAYELGKEIRLQKALAEESNKELQKALADVTKQDVIVTKCFKRLTEARNKAISATEKAEAAAAAAGVATRKAYPKAKQKAEAAAAARDKANEALTTCENDYKKASIVLRNLQRVVAGIANKAKQDSNKAKELTELQKALAEAAAAPGGAGTFCVIGVCWDFAFSYEALDSRNLLAVEFLPNLHKVVCYWPINFAKLEGFRSLEDKLKLEDLHEAEAAAGAGEARTKANKAYKKALLNYEAKKAEAKAFADWKENIYREAEATEAEAARIAEAAAAKVRKEKAQKDFAKLEKVRKLQKDDNEAEAARIAEAAAANEAGAGNIEQLEKVETTINKKENK